MEFTPLQINDISLGRPQRAPDIECDAGYLWALVKKAITGLTNGERMFDIIWLSYHGWTFDEIGKKYSIRRERVRQIHVKALRILRHPYHKIDVYREGYNRYTMVTGPNYRKGP